MPEGYIYASEGALGVMARAHLGNGWEIVDIAGLQDGVRSGVSGIVVYEKGDSFPLGFMDTAARGDCTFLALSGTPKPESISHERFKTFEPGTFVKAIEGLKNKNTLQ